MATRTAQVTVSTTAAALPCRATDRGQQVLVKNAGEVAAYLGVEGVTASTGYPFDPGAEATLPLQYGEQLHAVTDTGTTLLALLWLAP